MILRTNFYDNKRFAWYVTLDDKFVGFIGANSKPEAKIEAKMFNSNFRIFGKGFPISPKMGTHEPKRRKRSSKK